MSIILAAFIVAAFTTAGAQALDDPTRPDGYRQVTGQAAVKYTLNSVMIGDQRKVAIINGRSYSEGEQTPLGRLEQVHRDRVVIAGGSRQVLRLVDVNVRSLR